MNRSTVSILILWLCTALPGAAAQTGTAAGNAAAGATVHEACLQSIFGQLRVATGRGMLRRWLGECDAALAAAGDTLDGETLFHVHIEQAKRAFLARNYDKVKHHTDAASSLGAPPDAPDVAAFRASVIETIEILRTALDGDVSAALGAAEALSDRAPGHLWVHKLFKNLAAQDGKFELSMTAYRRQLRLRPSVPSFKDLAFIENFYKKPEDARHTLLAALAMAKAGKEQSDILLDLARVEVALGNLEAADYVLALLDDDTGPDERLGIQAAAFAGQSALVSIRIRPARSFRYEKKARLEKAYLLLHKGDKAAAVNTVEGLRLDCTDLRCTRLELAIAEEYGDAARASRLKRELETSVVGLKRTPGDWEKAVMASLPTIPLERYAAKPTTEAADFSVSGGEDGLYEFVLTDPVVQHRARLRASMIRQTNDTIKSLGFKAFMIEKLNEGYQYRKGRHGAKIFARNQWKMTVRALSEADLAAQPAMAWRHILVE